MPVPRVRASTSSVGPPRLAVFDRMKSNVHGMLREFSRPALIVVHRPRPGVMGVISSGGSRVRSPVCHVLLDGRRPGDVRDSVYIALCAKLSVTVLSARPIFALCQERDSRTATKHPVVPHLSRPGPGSSCPLGEQYKLALPCGPSVQEQGDL